MALGKRPYRIAIAGRERDLRRLSTECERMMLHLWYGAGSSPIGLADGDPDFVATRLRVSPCTAEALLCEAAAAGLLVRSPTVAYCVGTFKADPPAARNNWLGLRKEIALHDPCTAKAACEQELGEWDLGAEHWIPGVLHTPTLPLPYPLSGGLDPYPTQTPTPSPSQPLPLPPGAAVAPPLRLLPDEPPAAKQPHLAIVALWAELLPKLGQPRKTDPESKLGIALRKAWKADPDETIWRHRFERIGKNHWLQTEWRPDLLRMLALTEETDGGRYDQKGPAPEPHMYDTAKVFR